MHSASGQEGESVKPKQLHCTTDGKAAVILLRSQVQAIEKLNEKTESENEWARGGCSTEGYLSATAQVNKLR